MSVLVLVRSTRKRLKNHLRYMLVYVQISGIGLEFTGTHFMKH